MSGKTVDKSKPKYKSKFEKTTKIKKKNGNRELSSLL